MAGLSQREGAESAGRGGLHRRGGAGRPAAAERQRQRQRREGLLRGSAAATMPVHSREKKENNHDEMEVDYGENEGSSSEEEETESSSVSEEGDSSGTAAARGAAPLRGAPRRFPQRLALCPGGETGPAHPQPLPSRAPVAAGAHPRRDPAPPPLRPGPAQPVRRPRGFSSGHRPWGGRDVTGRIGTEAPLRRGPPAQEPAGTGAWRAVPFPSVPCRVGAVGCALLDLSAWPAAGVLTTVCTARLCVH